MKVSREKVEKALDAQFSSVGKNKTKTIRDELKNKYGFPDRVVSEFISKRKDLSEADDFMLFALTDVYYSLPKRDESIETAQKRAQRIKNNWFSTAEIGHYSKDTYQKNTIAFPLRFKMLQVREDQYIGTIMAKELMKLRDAGLINYNENAQRTMTHVVKNGEEYWKITLNKKAVEDIKESFAKGLYIPDTITLNIPEDAEFYYDEENHEIVIKEMQMFDITDGYHRYIAIGNLFTLDPDFDYEMELRLTNFNIEKANRFIWQGDQKTRMTKVKSDSLDPSKLSNRICEKLNSGNTALNGQISRNKGLVDMAQLSDCIDNIYLKEYHLKTIKKSEEIKIMKMVQETLADNINAFIESEPTVLDIKHWDKKLILSMVYESKYGSMENVLDTYEKIKDNKTIYAQSALARYDITRMNKLLGRA